LGRFSPELGQQLDSDGLDPADIELLDVLERGSVNSLGCLRQETLQNETSDEVPGIVDTLQPISTLQTGVPHKSTSAFYYFCFPIFHSYGDFANGLINHRGQSRC
jgi:hypothetical protein